MIACIEIWWSIDMDNYILMCQTAREIQERWEPKEGDWFIYRTENRIRLTGSSLRYPDTYKMTRWWIPTQEQLQGMIDWSPFSYKVSTQAFQINEFYNTMKIMPESMSELWLAFVMFELYQKQWSADKKWVGV